MEFSGTWYTHISKIRISSERDYNDFEKTLLDTFILWIYIKCQALTAMIFELCLLECFFIVRP